MLAMQAASARPNQPSLELGVTSSSPGAEAATSSATYFAIEDITAGGMTQTAFPAVSRITEQFESSVQLQHMSGQVGSLATQSLMYQVRDKQPLAI